MTKNEDNPCEPSVEGNEIVFCNPRLENATSVDHPNYHALIRYGSSEMDLSRGFMIFKNENGVVWKKEKFDPHMVAVHHGEQNE